MSALTRVEMAPWIMGAYQNCVSLMAKNEECFAKRLAHAVTETLWQEDVLDKIPPIARDQMNEWLLPACDVNIFEGENLLKYDINDLHEIICKMNDDKAYSAIENICNAFSEITNAAVSGGYEVKK